MRRATWQPLTSHRGPAMWTSFVGMVDGKILGKTTKNHEEVSNMLRTIENHENQYNL